MIKIIRSSLDIICSGTFVLYPVGALANRITPDSVPIANSINKPTLIEATGF